jgi:tRNA(Ile)-lysidine synthase
VRPLLGVSRRRLERYVRHHEIAWVEDPTNSDTRFLRNRVRRDLLPAIRAQQPSFEREIVALARRAARVRSATELLASSLAQGNENRLVVDRRALAGFDRDALAHLWPALAARLGAVLDQRGVHRASEFVLTARSGQQAQCAGGVRLECTRDAVVLSRAPAAVPSIARIGSTVEFGAWRLRRVRKSAFAERQKSGALWTAAVDNQESYYVRAWQPGDTVRPRGRALTRKVKRFFQEQAIPATERRAWPVVLSGGNVLWVPGVCLSDEAVEYERGRLTYLVCERRDR